MRTIEVKVLKFTELSDKSKQRVKDKYAEMFGYNWSEDSLASLKALAKHFGGELKKYEVDFFNTSYSTATFDMPELTEREIKAKLKELGTYNKQTGKGHGDCKLTGFCADEDAIDGFRLAWRAGERDLDKLMQAAFDSWLKQAQADCADQYTDETFADHCEANEYEYFENGDMA